MDKDGRKLLSRQQRKAKVNALIAQIAAYPYWEKVLTELGLQKAPQISPNLAELMQQAAQRGKGAGESEEHRKLKMFVKNNPHVISVNRNCRSATEHPLISGDRLDVLFSNKDLLVAVEVKSHVSDEADLMRGLFQCVKYQAVLEAELRSKLAIGEVRTVLVSTRELTPELLRVKNILGVEFIELPRLHE
ncbi:hypothetical protein [Prosthecobacter vanneervenii]|uniref:Endonuclease NucS n=1 Tax=Prosthecobacter vanneervenii TaxID=48466 RepID=A0A7W7YC77_9BACT|nr:hypothetical protein [Prosthecobacter vanneervenii]MBB5033342.1 hypothetical protein [Prosthecobacter vanneervenii]